MISVWAAGWASYCIITSTSREIQLFSSRWSSDGSLNADSQTYSHRLFLWQTEEKDRWSLPHNTFIFQDCVWSSAFFTEELRDFRMSEIKRPTDVIKEDDKALIINTATSRCSLWRQVFSKDSPSPPPTQTSQRPKLKVHSVALCLLEKSEMSH